MCCMFVVMAGMGVIQTSSCVISFDCDVKTRASKLYCENKAPIPGINDNHAPSCESGFKFPLQVAGNFSANQISVHSVNFTSGDRFSTKHNKLWTLSRNLTTPGFATFSLDIFTKTGRIRASQHIKRKLVNQAKGKVIH